MAANWVTGGQPVVVSGTAPAGQVSHWRWYRGIGHYLYLQNLDASSDLTLYFSATDAAASKNGIVIPAGIGRVGNPFSLPIELGEFFLSASPGPVDFSALILVRRG